MRVGGGGRTMPAAYRDSLNVQVEAIKKESAECCCEEVE